MAHCDGVISDQYISVCKKQNYSFKEEVKAGSKLEIPPEYFYSSCRLVMKVGLMLGQTLWRKILPDELNKADEQLNSSIYDILKSERWRMAREIGEFAHTIPNLSNPVQKRMIFVNYVIALKFGGKAEEAQRVLSSIDWSDTSNDFKLAQAVLSNNYEESIELMKRIGRRGEYVSEHAYHVWPLFREFRQTEGFLKAYEDIYGYAFAVELQRSTDEAIAKTEQQMEEKKQELEAAVETSNESGAERDISGEALEQKATQENYL